MNKVDYNDPCIGQGRGNCQLNGDNFCGMVATILFMAFIVSALGYALIKLFFA